MLSRGTLEFGEHAARALLATDALYRKESGDAFGLVVLNMDLDETLEVKPFNDYTEARLRWDHLALLAQDLEEADRRVYYDQLCISTRAFIRWRDEGLPFQEQLAQFLHVPPEAASSEDLADITDALDRALGDLGFTGPLAERCAAWEASHRVPAEEVQSVLANLMDEAWKRTESEVLPIPAPPSDGMRVATLTGVPYNARCDYLDRTVAINVDPVLTRPGLKHLAVHEGYPGHYVQFKLRETGVREGWAAADVLLSVVNTASSSVFEGIADTGMAMVGWDEDPDDRVQALLTRHRAGIGTVAAWMLHVEGRPESEVFDWLLGAALVGGEGWVRNRLDFIRAPERAVLIWSYWWGERSVLPVWEAVPASERADFIRYLYGRMHSVQTVGMFA